MNFKVVLVAGVIALSGQSAFAATETSCNPFARGEKCEASTVASSVANSHSAFFRSLATWRGASERVAATRPSESRGIGFMRLLRGSNIQAVVINEDTDFDDDEDVVVVVEDNGQSGDDISVVPVPAAGFLLLAGLGGLIAVRRKKS